MAMKKLSITVLLIVFLFSFLSVSPARADSEAAADISNQLICQCGCGRILDSHVCDTQEAMVALIEQKLAQGQSQEEILNFFVTLYGEQVLSTPPKRGFNLVVWVVPPAALLFGAGVVYVALKGWVRRDEAHETGAVPGVSEGDDEYRDRLEKELKEFDGRGFR